LKVNREIRTPKVRLIDEDGEQVGIVSLQEAMSRADDAGLDLVEVVPTAVPPVCKIMNYGKFRYDQTKREKESKKSQHQIKVKEVKVKPNIDQHDLDTKKRHAREFIEKGNKVKITCTFRGREMVHTEIGEKVVRQLVEGLEDVAAPESPPKMLGRTLGVVLIPSVKKKKEAPKAESKPAAPAKNQDAPLE
jgi:translation initiation factor IF-3